MWMLRDARGLNKGQKTFLLIIESRGTSIASKATLKDDMGGISENTFQRWKKNVIESKLVFHNYRDHETTEFVVNDKALSAYVPWELMVKYVPAEILATYPSPKIGEGGPPNLGRGDTSFGGEGSPVLGEGPPPF